jgi:hypothetical protein
MMAAERRAREAEAQAQQYREGLERAQRAAELEEFRSVYERQAATQADAMQREIADAEARAAAIEMADTEAAAAAQAGAMYIPPPPSMIPMAPPTLTTTPSGAPPPAGEPAGEPVSNGTPWGMIMLAVAAVGIVAAGAAGKRKRKR